MLKSYFVLIHLMLILSCFAIPVDQLTAKQAACNQLQILDKSQYLVNSHPYLIQDNEKVLGYIFALTPTGYIVVSSDDALPPIIAYSTTSTFDDSSTHNSILKEIIKTDLNLRMHNLPLIPESQLTKHRSAWSNLLLNQRSSRFQQWPPEGTTASGGWMKTQWTQSNPYNMFCPMDLVTNNRSLAGCPAVAMAQILNYHATINGTNFNDADDYHHNYSGNNYWIDNDFLFYSFPSFQQLNNYLATMMHHYNYQEEITNSDKAAIVFACGVAAQQVYASAGSGTFSVNQAFQAYQRFGFSSVQLQTEDIPELYSNIASNIMSAMPVHLAIETPDLNSGHNVVVDGYNTNQFYHLNFGWGGAYDGWYLLPDDLPFGLSMIEGAIIDIQPTRYVDISPSAVIIQSPVVTGQPYVIEIWNNCAGSVVTLEDYLFDTSFAEMNWELLHEDLPKTLAYTESTSVSMIPQALGNNSGNLFQTYLRIILNTYAIDVPIQYQSPIQNDDEDTPELMPIFLMQNYPNPFSSITNIGFEMKEKQMFELNIYNIQGKLVRNLVHWENSNGKRTVQWDRKDDNGVQVSSGIYVYQLHTNRDKVSKKMVYIK